MEAITCQQLAVTGLPGITEVLEFSMSCEMDRHATATVTGRIEYEQIDVINQNFQRAPV